MPRQRLRTILNHVKRNRLLADANDRIRRKLKSRDCQVLGRGPLTNPARCIVMGAVAGAKPSPEIASLTQWHTTEMGADADHHDPVFPSFAGRPGEVGGGLIIHKICISGYRIDTMTASRTDAP